MNDKPVRPDERREFDRRRGERRTLPYQPWWRANWKGVVGILAGIATLLTPVLDYLQRSSAMEYQYRLELRRAEIEAMQKMQKARVPIEKKEAP